MEYAANSTVEEPIGVAIARAVVAGLPRVAVADLPDGMVAILRRSILRAGLDLQLVRQLLWNTTGGFESETYVRAARGHSGPLNPEPYFAFPLTALAPPR